MLLVSLYWFYDFINRNKPTTPKASVGSNALITHLVIKHHHNGPMKYPTRTKCKMFITIVDDFSRMTWIYLVKNNCGFSSIFAQFICLFKKTT
jgi:hypothetical protein